MSALHKANYPSRAGQSAKGATDIRIVAAAPEQRKRQTTLIAKLALRGHVVYTSHDGFLVCRHGYVRHCADLVDLEAFARLVGVTS